jgi:predicted rRNA methylase YqxC with S4 and FtsJ domains
MTNFNARSFWNTRHSRNFGPESVGYAGLGVPYNKWMYRVRERVLTHQLQKQNISVKGKDVLDIGSGTGFYIRIWDEFGARSVTGSAFAPFAVNELNNKFSQHRFVNLDISVNCRLDTRTVAKANGLLLRFKN